jgi:hypothetical protein
VQCRRREPLEEGRNGLVEGHRYVSILTRSVRVLGLLEWIDDMKPVDNPAVWHLFAE